MRVDRPRKAVFATAELLEKILLYLSPTHAIAIQRTCTQFRDVMRTSTKLKDHTFLRSRQTNTSLWAVRTTRAPGVTTHEIFEKFTNETLASDFRALVTPVSLHPLMVPDYAFTLRLKNWDTFEETVENIVLLKLPKHSQPRGKESWRSMYITSPPVTEVKYYFNWSMTGNHFRVDGERTIAN